MKEPPINSVVFVCWLMFFMDLWGHENPSAWIGPLSGFAAVFFTVAIFAPTLEPYMSPKKFRRTDAPGASGAKTRWIFWVLAFAWIITFISIKTWLQINKLSDWAQVFPLLNICGLYVIWRFWPERKSEGEAEDIPPETGADSEK
jgi:hypothetical protein